MPDDVLSKYFKIGSWRYAARMDDNTRMVLVKREDDYLVATSKGEEIPLSYESMDKVRDIMSGNMTGLTDEETKFFNRFNDKDFLEVLARESMFRYLEKDGAKVEGMGLGLLLMDMLFNPGLMTPLREELKGEEKAAYEKRKETIEKYIKDNFGVKVDAGSRTFTDLLVKLASDHSFERKKFMKDTLKKKKD